MLQILLEKVVLAKTPFPICFIQKKSIKLGCNEFKNKLKGKFQKETFFVK
jgi:hypothetical protein